MTTISIVGSGNMATTIGTRAAKHGHTIEIMSRDTARAQAAAEKVGHGTTVGTFGAKPAGDIVILAVLATGAVEAVAHYGDALAGKTVVDITNPFNADASGLVTTEGNSISQQIAAAVPDAHVVKAFNSIFRGILAEDKPLDVFFAGDNAEAKTGFAAFPGKLGHAASGRRRARNDLGPGMDRHPDHGAGPQRRRLRSRPGRRHPLTILSTSGENRAGWLGRRHIPPARWAVTTGPTRPALRPPTASTAVTVKSSTVREPQA